MKRILLSLVTLGIVGVIATGATTALFSDDEVSTGNTFTAGAVDLQIDNESYYNGVLNASTTWLEPRDLDDGNGPANGLYLFFDFLDLKPGDWGEDTISIHVDNNDSWLCVDVTLTSDDDNGCNEPELGDGDVSCGDPGLGEGELADAVNFIWWADDGDNVLEDDEVLLPAGPLGALAVGETATVPLADSNVNIWEGNGPLPGDEVRYIGKAWCFGDLTPNPEPQDGSGTTTNPTIATGFDCNGAPVNNVTQTDSMTADIAFRAVQSRNNNDYICEPPDVERQPIVTVTKEVDNSQGGSAVPGDFNLYVNGDPVTSGIPAEVATGTLLTVTEDQLPDYEATFSGDCDANGEISPLAVNETATCTITNTFMPATSTLTVTKSVVGTTTAVAEFNLFADATPLTSGVQETLTPGVVTVNETFDPSLDNLFETTFGGECDPNGDVTLVEDGIHSCTITNTYAAGDITVDKIVTFSSINLGTSVSDFDLFIDDGVNGPIQLTDEVTVGDLPAGTYTVSEVYTGVELIDVDAQFTGDCSDDGDTGTIILGLNGSASCTITNVVSPSP